MCSGCEDHAMLNSSSDFEQSNTKASEAVWASLGFSHHRFCSYTLYFPQGSAASKSDLGATGQNVGAVKDPC